MDLERLYKLNNRSARPLWLLKPWEVDPGQQAEREIAIRAKAQELTVRNNNVEEAIGNVYDTLSISGREGTTADIRLPDDAETGTKYSATIGRSPNGWAWIKYFELGPDGGLYEIPRSTEHYTTTFDSPGNTELSLELSWSGFTWHNDSLDNDSARAEVLQAADAVIGAWESTTAMLYQAVRDAELNPTIATLFAERDARVATSQQA